MLEVASNLFHVSVRLNQSPHFQSYFQFVPFWRIQTQKTPWYQKLLDSIKLTNQSILPLLKIGQPSMLCDRMKIMCGLFQLTMLLFQEWVLTKICFEKILWDKHDDIHQLCLWFFLFFWSMFLNTVVVTSCEVKKTHGHFDIVSFLS